MIGNSTILCAVEVEPEFEEQLRAAGEVWTLDRGMPRTDVIEVARDADGILLTPGFRVDEELLNAWPSLRVVSSVSVGFDAFDVDLLTGRGVALCNTPGVLNAAVAEFFS